MLGFFKTKSPQTLHASEVKFLSSGALQSPMELRRKIPIVAIDDQIFLPEKNLKNSGFLIETLADIQRITDVEKYQIILCDVNGVGSALSESTQGAYVIEEIKSTYPDKVVIAYTAGSASSKLVSRARTAADRYIKKDASVEEWRDLLDEVVKSLCNPIAVWKKTRIRLLAAGIELQDLMKLEQALLVNLGKGKESVRSAIQHEVQTAEASSWKGEVTQFLVSKAFDLAFEYFAK